MANRIPEAFKKCRKDGKIAIIFMGHDETTSLKGAVPLWKVIHEPGYVQACVALRQNATTVVVNSARGKQALEECFYFSLYTIYNDGMGIALGGRALRTESAEPDWTDVMKALSDKLPPRDDAKLLAQGYSLMYYIAETHPQYQPAKDVFAAMISELNEKAGEIKWAGGAYPNGHIIELKDKRGKEQGIKDFLELLCKTYGCENIADLLDKEVGCVIFADDSLSPTVQAAHRYVKDLKCNGQSIGYSYLVSRDNTVPDIVPGHVNEVVRNPTEMVALLSEMGAYRH